MVSSLKIYFCGNIASCEIVPESWRLAESAAASYSLKKPTRTILFLPFLMLMLATITCAQDCIDVTFSVRGQVVDEANTPIANANIRAWNDGSYERAPVSLMTISDSSGFFGTDRVFSYACTPFYVEVSADGFAPKKQMYYPPSGEGWQPVLPDSIIVTLARR